MEVLNWASNMSFSSVSGSTLMAIIQVKESDKDETYIIDNTYLFCYLFFLKFIFNVLTVVLMKTKLLQSFLGLFCLSLFLADLLLLYLVIEVKALSMSERSSALCSLLVSFSRVYKVVPLPAFVLGAVDHLYFFQLASWCKMTWYCVQILVIYLSALVFEADSTALSPVMLLPINDSVDYILCPIQGSVAISAYCIILVLAGILISLFFWKDMFSLAKLHINHLLDAENVSGVDVSSSDISPMGSSKAETGCKSLQMHPLLSCHHRRLLAIATCFLVYWFVFLFMNILGMLLHVPIPSYVSVNILWALSLNSFLTGAVYCFRSMHLTEESCFPDGVCNWTFFLKACQNDVEQPE
ncbi:probable G-protein coupled receptor 160 [Protopterus annectens]|uniref:probable G-protein coupled receptor 160 n=1 Tax=Protopterus annectens TaxID=7888 RepID=UPI001CFA2F2A|nr:probable G-protein coupled receptor 160 [Protopterus annectens]XP_043917909.1 probable G-protein coupled receptor 160 [Protopterus annectens]